MSPDEERFASAPSGTDSASIRCSGRLWEGELERYNVMSETRTIASEEMLPGAGGSFASSLAVALVTAAIGWILVKEAVWQTQHVMASVASFVLLSAVVNLLWIQSRDGGRFGQANQATLLRSGLVCLIGSTLLASGQTPIVGWHLLGLIALALALDAVDGFLARKFNLASAFGARFDMEIDALLLFILSLLVWRTGQAGAWVLAIGLMRYVFVAASWFFRPLAAPLRPSLRRKTVCALQGVALLTCLLPPLDQTGASAVAAAALIALSASFVIDIKALLELPSSVRSAKEGAGS
jgi:phosphatidylglycerophosphate synthase